MNKALEKTIDKILDDYDISTYQSLPQIGKKYNRDHTSIINGLKKLEERHPKKIKFYKEYYLAEKEKEKQLD